MENEVIDASQEADQMTPEQLEEILIEQGIMIPYGDLVHYMTRNDCYMKLINSPEFKESGLDLDTILDNEYITNTMNNAKKTAQVMRFVTEKVVAQMNEVPTEVEEIEEEE